MIFMKTQSNFYLFLIALISAMGGFLFGYDWVVIGGAKPFYEQYFGIAGNPVMQGWAMSSALIGCLFGALSAGKLSDRLGRKPILILAAGLFICTAVGTGAVHSFTFFNEFPRVLAGFDYNHYGASSMDFSVQKASFLRLSALTLAYTFPTKVINALKLTNLRVYATGSNLFCLTNYNGYDPETGDWYPPTRMYTFGLNLAF